MNSQETQESHNPPQNYNQSPSFISRFKPFTLFSIFVLILAISFNFPKPNFFKIQHLKSIFSPTHSVLWFLHSTPNANYKRNPQLQTNPNSMPPYCVLWMAPFLSGGGYSSEAWSYILSLHEHMKNPRFRLSIDQHGDQQTLEFWEGLPQEMKFLALQLYQTECKVNETIVICHSEPGAWYPSLFQTNPCPPTEYSNFKFVIGRTMFETDRVNPEHVRRCNQMDFVWVPTEFHVSTFTQSGVDPSKIVKIVQPIDVKFFDPYACKPLDLSSRGTLVLGSTPSLSIKKEFKFLSVFKWEYRKGWDVLLKSYLKEFSKKDEVALYILTNAYHSDSDFVDKVVEFVENSHLGKPSDGWAPVYVIDSHISHIDLPGVYKASDAFVLPSRGEGWGRPIVEAMAMSLPVIATNWSGPTEYLSEDNSYPLPVDRMSKVLEGPFKGHLWAEPSVEKLRVLMRHVMSNSEEAKAKGRKAREIMVNGFSPEIVAGIVSDRIAQILDRMI